MEATEDMMAEINTNSDLWINVGDHITEEEYYHYLAICDTNMDHNIDFCEIHDCILRDESDWRIANCPEEFGWYPTCYCNMPEPDCPLAWNCGDVEFLTYAFFDYYNTNGNYGIETHD
jgi:hypothetical protein